ncbi:MAG: gliding motility lipoprotein GldH [Ferruginibacter sp.]
MNVNNKLTSLSISFAVAVLLIASCNQIDLYEKNAVIPHYQWKSDYKATGSILIKDTNSSYNVYVVLRHTDAYGYNNIWLDVGLQAPGDSIQSKKINISLGIDAGGWEGTGMDDIWEVRKLISANSNFFKKPGLYNFYIGQAMRDNPLQHIMSAGLRIEKTNQ